MKKKCFAFCFRSGQIEFGNKVPDGSFELAAGQENIVRDVIGATARPAYDNKTLLVPGIPEAANDEEAIAAVCRYVEWLAKRNRPGFRAIN